MKNENRLVPDFRTETIEEITETYTPEGGAEQTATYKIGTAHPIIGGILDKFTWIRTHAAAVWWNALERVTLRDKITAMDEQIAQLNGSNAFFAYVEFASSSNYTQAIKDHWPEFPQYKYCFLRYTAGSGVYCGIIYKEDANHGWAHIMSYTLASPIYLVVSGGTWNI